MKMPVPIICLYNGSNGAERVTINDRLRVHFFKKIQDWIDISERIGKQILDFFSCLIHFQTRFVGSFNAPWSERSWIDLLSKERKICFCILLDLRI